LGVEPAGNDRGVHQPSRKEREMGILWTILAVIGLVVVLQAIF
jgi:hypothetical protein